jgi:hypothetical protein
VHASKKPRVDGEEEGKQEESVQDLPRSRTQNWRGMRRNKLYTSGGGGGEEDKYTASKKLQVEGEEDGGRRISTPYRTRGFIQRRGDSVLGHLPNTRLSLILFNPQPLGGTQRITHKCSREWRGLHMC